jgi:hypothetical protein
MTKVLEICKRLTKEDTDLLFLLYQTPLSEKYFATNNNKILNETLKRAKARTLIISLKKGDIVYYELSKLGFRVIQIILCKRQMDDNK